MMTTSARSGTSPGAIAAYEPVIGLEVHVELGTATKMFCGCATVFGAEPNTQVCPVCLGPARLAARRQRGGGRVDDPDRPGAQLHDRPVVPVRAEELLLPGHAEELPDVAVRRADRVRRLARRRAGGRIGLRVEIERAHMEEDTGKTLHVGGATGRIHGADYSLVDYNRAGIPLIEIVTKPMTGPATRAGGRPRLRHRAARRCSARSRSPTCGWSRARCAATPTSRCDPRRTTSARAPGPRPRTSTRCVASSGRCATRSRARRRSCAPAADRAGDAALARGHRRHHVRACEERRHGLPVLPGARPGADRAVAEWVEELRRRCRSRPRCAATGCRRTGASRTWRCRRRRQRRRGRARSRRPSRPAHARRRPQVVDGRGGPARQRAGRGRRRSRRRPASPRRRRRAGGRLIGRLND